MVIASTGSRVMALAAGLLAVGAALACVVGDLALQYTPNRGDLFASDYRYCVGIPERWLLLGHCVGVLAPPCRYLESLLSRSNTSPERRSNRQMTPGKGRIDA